MRWFLLALVVSLVGGLSRSAPAIAQATPRCPFDTWYFNGAVFSLEGTPHLWIFEFRDGAGLLHWAGDTRALGGRSVQWDQQCSMDIAYASRVTKGDPWLSAGLVKIGSPIYLVKWETQEAAPSLFHIQSIADLELFGINATNYGAFVLERAEWQRRYGLNINTLRRAEIPAAITRPAAVAPSAGNCIQYDRNGNCTQFAGPPPPGTCIQYDSNGTCIQVVRQPPSTPSSCPPALNVSPVDVAGLRLTQFSAGWVGVEGGGVVPFVRFTTTNTTAAGIPWSDSRLSFVADWDNPGQRRSYGPDHGRAGYGGGLNDLRPGYELEAVILGIGAWQGTQSEGQLPQLIAEVSQGFFQRDRAVGKFDVPRRIYSYSHGLSVCTSG